MISTAQKMKKPLTENFACVQSQSWAQQASSALVCNQTHKALLKTCQSYTLLDMVL